MSYCPTSVEGLSLAVFHDWDPDRLFMLATVYIDASGHHGGSPVMTLAGRVATARQWRNFDRQWKWLLDKNELTFFHAKEFKACSGEFSGWSDDRQATFLKRAERIIQRNTQFGFASALKHEDFKSIYRAKPPKKTKLYSMYGVAFWAVLLQVVPILRRSYRKGPLRVNFVLETGDPGSGSAKELFDDAKSRAPSDWANVIGTLTYGDKKEFYGLQSADFLAYGSFHAEQNSPEQTRLPRQHTIRQAQKKAAYESHVLRFNITPAVLRELREKSIADIGDRRRNRLR